MTLLQGQSYIQQWNALRDMILTWFCIFNFLNSLSGTHWRKWSCGRSRANSGNSRWTMSKVRTGHQTLNKLELAKPCFELHVYNWLVLALVGNWHRLLCDGKAMSRTSTLSRTVMFSQLCCNTLVIDTVAVEKVLDSPGVFLVLLLSSPESCWLNCAPRLNPNRLGSLTWNV